MTDERSPLDLALDLVLYAPLGLALTVGEEVPKLAAKGRSRFVTQWTTAKVVGQFAVAQGKREVARRTSGEKGPKATPAPSAPARVATAAASSARPATPTVPTVAPTGAVAAPRPAPTGNAATNGSVTEPPMHRTAVTPNRETTPDPEAASDPAPTPDPAATAPVPAPTGPPPDVNSLAIPGYDSLSASQVVQRLAGLDRPELEAVRVYEAATRARRTILARAAQLQAT